MLLVELTTVYNSEILVVTVVSECLVLPVHSVLIVFLGKTIFAISNRVSGSVTSKQLDQAICQLDWPEGLSRLVQSSILHILGIRHLHGAVLREVARVVLVGAKVVVRLEELVCVGLLTLAIALPHCVTPSTLEAI